MSRHGSLVVTALIVVKGSVRLSSEVTFTRIHVGLWVWGCMGQKSGFQFGRVERRVVDVTLV